MKWRKAKKETEVKKAIDNDIKNNPYLQSRALYNDIYGNAENRYHRARILNYMLSGCLILSIIGMTYIGSQSKYIPYVVQVQDGQILYGNVANQSNISKERPLLAVYFLKRFLITARSVSVDGGNDISNEKIAFSFTSGMATKTLSDYLDNHDPIKIAQNHSITLKINYINKLKGDSYQSGWTEIYRNSTNGNIIATAKFNGTFTTKWNKPSHNLSILKRNPFGFYVTSIAWTEVTG